jgi:hypothetical protein
MKRDILLLAQRAIEEEWDAYKIMAEMCSLQKEIDANIAEKLGNLELANLIRTQ